MGDTPPTTLPWASALVWFRRDLRAEDHAALHLACTRAKRVWCCFVFDTEILDPLPRADRRVEFIRDSLVDLDGQLRALALSHGVADVGLIVLHGRATDLLPRLADRLGVQAVCANHDDEPAALQRDAMVRGALANLGIAWQSRKDHVVFERAEIMTASGTPYTVFTPYKNAWLKKVGETALAPWPVAPHAAALAPWPAERLAPTDRAGTTATAAGASGIHVEPGVPALGALGFERTNLHTLKLATGSTGAAEMLSDFLPRIDAYAQARDFPAVKGPSYLSTHLRFGTVSIRHLAGLAWRRAGRAGGAGSPGAQSTASPGAATWLSELIWRDFYHQVLHHRPRVVGHAFRPEYDALKWEHGKHADALFAAWAEGRTGYPMVDAAMRQLVRTGYMHNRLRMVAASFLVKDLGIDWRRGEACFALHLNDFDLAANNGGWQWAASTGCDAQPYFRIFNPVTQSEKFDPDGKFIKRYVPELATLPAPLVHAPWLARPIDLASAGIALGSTYPLPIVQHDEARERTLARFAAVRGAAKPG
jgi:deoxyribodipyrimidine photo-lyase